MRVKCCFCKQKLDNTFENESRICAICPSCNQILVFLKEREKLAKEMKPYFDEERKKKYFLSSIKF